MKAPVRRQIKAKPAGAQPCGVTSATARRVLQSLERMSSPLAVSTHTHTQRADVSSLLIKQEFSLNCCHFSVHENFGCNVFVGVCSFIFFFFSLQDAKRIPAGAAYPLSAVCLFSCIRYIFSLFCKDTSYSTTKGVITLMEEKITYTLLCHY